MVTFSSTTLFGIFYAFYVINRFQFGGYLGGQFRNLTRYAKLAMIGGVVWPAKDGHGYWIFMTN